DRPDVMTIDLVDVPAEDTPALRHRGQVQHLLRVAERLLAVQIDDRDEVGEAVVRGKHHRLPERALIALRVADEDEAPAPRALQARRERRSRRQREPLSQGARREIDTLQAMLRVDAQQRSVATEGIERLPGDPAPEVQGGVESEGGVSLG